MAYNETLVERIHLHLGELPDLQVKKMFGGVGFILRGNMAVGVLGDEMLVRVSPQETAAALAQPFTRVFDMTGRPMKGWVVVGPGGIAEQADFESWVKTGIDCALSLPPK